MSNIASLIFNVLFFEYFLETREYLLLFDLVIIMNFDNFLIHSLI